MTKTTIRTSTISATGYELVTIDEQGNESVLAIQSTYKGEPKTLILPENPCNRKYFNSDKVDKAGGEIELTYKESKSFGPRSESVSRKGIEEWLNDDDKALYLALVEKAKKARDEANKKPKMTDLEKAEAAVARAMAKVEALRKAAGNQE